MEVTIGNQRRFYLTTSQHASYAWLEGEQSNNFDLAAEMIDTSDKSSNWQQATPGQKSGTANVSVHLDNSATSAQKDLLAGITAGTRVYCFIGTLSDGSSPAPTEGDLFAGYVTAVSESNEKNGVSSRSFSIQLDGAPTHYPAA